MTNAQLIAISKQFPPEVRALISACCGFTSLCDSKHGLAAAMLAAVFSEGLSASDQAVRSHMITNLAMGINLSPDDVANITENLMAKLDQANKDYAERN